MDGGDLITVELSTGFFNCPFCSKPYQPPIFQCNAGHSLCSRCRKMSGKDCRTCQKATVYKHNKTLESIVTRTKFRCVNRKYGCRKLCSGHDKANHQRKCLYLPIFCPETNRNFQGSSDKLPGHLAVKHKQYIEDFRNGEIFTVYLFDESKMIPLVAEDGTVFLLQNREEASGKVISAVCIRSPRRVKEPNFLCDLKVKKDNNGAPEAHRC